MERGSMLVLPQGYDASYPRLQSRRIVTKYFSPNHRSTLTYTTITYTTYSYTTQL